MAKWDSLRKAKRDKKIYRFWLSHKDMSHEEIAKREHMSRTNVTRIINNEIARIEKETGI
jgi:Mor family transcriptional regulator